MDEGRILYGVHEGTHVFKLEGDVRQCAMGGVGRSAAFYDFISLLCRENRIHNAVFDCRDAAGIDSTYLGLMAQVAVDVMEKHGHKPVLISNRSRITDLLNGMGFDSLFLIVKELDAPLPELEAIPEPSGAGSDPAQVILEAHRTLAEMNESNREAFQNVIRVMEQECP